MVAVVRCFSAFARSPVARPKWQWATSGRIPSCSARITAARKCASASPIAGGPSRAAICARRSSGLVTALLALAREFLGSRQSRTARLQAWPPPRRSVVDRTSCRTCARRHSQSRTARRRRRASFRTLGRTQHPKERRAGTGDIACRKASQLVEAGTGRTGDESLVSRAVWVNPVSCLGLPAVPRQAPRP